MPAPHTTSRVPHPAPGPFEEGFLLGVLVGEGHFGGTGKIPQVTLRMHVRHEDLFSWILNTFGGRLYGPYHHGGRHYYQWMARSAFLRETLLPILTRHLPVIDTHVASRIRAMCHTYGLPIPDGPCICPACAAAPADRAQDREDATAQTVAETAGDTTTPPVP